MYEYSRKIHDLTKGVESLSKAEHGLIFDIVHRLGLSNDVKQAAVALYLDFKSRPAGKYNFEHKNLEIFLISSVSIAAKALGEVRTDQEFESKMFVSRDRLVDAEDRLLRTFGVQNSVVRFSELVSQLSKRQIESMAEGFASRELVTADEKERLIECSDHYLDVAVENGLSPRMSYRGRAAGAMLKAARDLELAISEGEIARAAGFDRKSMTANSNVIESLLKDVSRV